MHSSVVNDRLLSTFELSICGIVDALFMFLKFVQKDIDCEKAVIFRKVSILCYRFLILHHFITFVSLRISAAYYRSFYAICLF